MTATVSTIPEPGQKFASRRLYRLLSLSLSITALLMLLMLLPVMPEQAQVVGPWFSPVAAAVIGVPAVLALFVFRTARIRTLRLVWRIQAIGMLACYLATPLVLVGGQIPRGPNSFWMFEVETVAGCAAVLAWRVRTLVAYVVSVQVIMFTVGVFFGAGSVAGPVVGDAVRSLVTMSMFTALAVALLRAGRLLDETTDSAVAEANRATRAEVARAARQSVEMLVHDRIIVALLAYANGTDAARSAVEAHAALSAITSETESLEEVAGVTPKALAWEMQALTTGLDPQIRFDYEAEGNDALPSLMSSAVVEALSEALRNSLRHAPAGRAVIRQVRATLTSDQVEVLVLDDGVGFDPTAIGAARLGVRHGILRRMEAVPGGSAEVRSRLGYGTMVALRWRRS